MEDSILNSVKKALGIQEDLKAFDQDILMNINSVFSILYQIGVISSKGTYRIEDETAKWEDFFGNDPIILDMIKTYTYTRVRILFDPPSSSFVLESLKSQSQELEWRIYIEAGKSESDEENGSSPSIPSKPGPALTDKDIKDLWDEIIGTVPELCDHRPMSDDEIVKLWNEIIEKR